MRRWFFWIALLLTACASADILAVTPAPVAVSIATFTLAPHATSTSTAPPPSATPMPADTSTPTATAHPLPTPDALAASRRVRLPILMYHYVEPWPADADEIRRGLTVTPEDFAAQMQYLHDHGYATVSLYDLVDALALGAPLPEKAVVLTFDDGYRTLPEYAAPEMQKHGYLGTVFVITELIDKELPQYLSWTQAEALYAQGWSIESHTKTHDELPNTGREFQVYEMLGAAQTIEAHTGRFPRFLCYPAGKYDATSMDVARALNLWGAVTTQFARTHTLAGQFEWGRVRVDGRGTLQDFINALSGE